MRKVIGITGSIGSGKTYAAKIFKEICEKNNVDAIFIDVDDVRRNILNQERINREELNRKIYTNINEMQKYKKFINPKIRNYLINQINSNNKYIFIEWALLLEDEFCDLVDSIIMINCSRESQIERLKSSNLCEKEILKRIDMQLANKEKIDKIKKVEKEYFILDTTYNPEIEEYENILKKEGLYE